MKTYLYLKTHNITGLKYLGKTVQDPFSYKGSGKRWIHHLNKHGNDVTTIILLETENNETLKEQGIRYSELWNIVDNPEFANMRPETGDGGDTSASENYKESIKNRDTSGTNNGMYGRSAVTENKLKWYNNGTETIYVTEGTEPVGYVRGRLLGKRRVPTSLTKQLIGKANSKSCISPNGEVFESTKAAGAAYGITSAAIGGLIKRGVSGWKYI
jgi:hypothetical protein